MKIAIFLHGTSLMHSGALGQSREVRVKQVQDREPSVKDYENYVPVGGAVQKLFGWESQGADVVYISSHEDADTVEKDRSVLKKYNFPIGDILFRKDGQSYKEMVEEIMPDVLIEDDCESIGGETEMIYPNLSAQAKLKIKSIVVKEFAGIDDFPDDINLLKGANDN